MTGGFTGFENTKSTEIFTTGDTTWTTVGDLPRARNGLRATNVNNMIYVLGKYHIITSWVCYEVYTVVQVEIQRY